MILFMLHWFLCAALTCSAYRYYTGKPTTVGHVVPKKWLPWPASLPPNFKSLVITPDRPPVHLPSLQSPINIRASHTTPRRLPDLRFVDLLSGAVHVHVENTGYTVEFTIANDSVTLPKLVGGPLASFGEFAFQNLHVHWGKANYRGGEHKINSRSFAMEGHCVHFNLKYRTFDEALKHEDGLAVVAFFLKADRRFKDSRALEEVVQVLPNITRPRSSVELKARQVLNWFADLGKPRGYFTYPGSLTTPPFTENVVWIIYPEPMPISTRQASAFRNLLLTEDLIVLKKNFRQIQPFNNRPLIYAI